MDKTNASSPPLPRPNLLPCPWLMALALMLALVALLGHDLLQSYNQAFTEARFRAENLGKLLDQQLSSSAKKIDIVLGEVVHDYAPIIGGTVEQTRHEGNRDLLRREMALEECQANSLRVVDAQGSIRFSAGVDESIPAIKLGDREYFLARKNSKQRMVVSEPIISRVTGQQVITFSQRIDFPDGGFAGLAQTAIRTQLLQNMLSNADIGQHGTIALISANDALVARIPDWRDDTGQAPEPGEIRAARDRAQTSGDYEATSPADAITRLHRFHKLGELPLILDIGLARDDFLADWKRKALRYTVAWLACGGLLLGMLLLDKRRARASRQRNGRLKTQLALADAASRAKSGLLANMSHEIRTPMNAIVGLTHLLRRDRITPPQAEKLTRIASAADHLLTIINDILELSRIEAGKVELEQSNFSPEEMLQRICNIVVHRAQAKKLELVVDIGDLPPVLHGDVTRLGQALLNYLSNAVKLTDKGSIVLRGKVAEEAEGALLVRFEVQDNGNGIPSEHLPSLFTTLEEADPATQRRYGGSGLGLIITSHLAKLMGGESGAYSNPGNGCTFWMTAWLGKAHQDPTPIEPELAGRRALVADDLQITQMVHTHLLRQIGLTPQAVASGKEAIEAIQRADADNDPFSILLLDLLMPDQSGMDTLAAIQKLDLKRPPICILVTASGDSSIAISARAAGFAGVLVKPINKAILQKAVTPHFAPTPPPSLPPDSRPELRLRWEYAGTRVLLVEDEPINQAIFNEFLEEAGMAITVADHGQTAVKLAERKHYDLILMDIQMPVMDGLQATRQIRALGGYADVPIIALSANAFAEDRNNCLQAGMNDFISKPTDPNVLFATLYKWLAAGTPQAPATPKNRQ